MSDERLWLPPPHALRGYTPRDQERLLVAYDASLTEREEDRAKLALIIQGLTKAGRKKLDDYNAIRRLVVWDLDDFATLVGASPWSNIDDRSDWGSGIPHSFVEDYAREHDVDVDDAWMQLSEEERNESYKDYVNSLTGAVFRYSDDWMSWSPLPVAIEGADPYEWEFTIGGMAAASGKEADQEWRRRATLLLEEEYREGVNMQTRTMIDVVTTVITFFEESFDATAAHRYYSNR